MKDKLNGKTILVTGGTGSIGGEIVRQLLNYDVKKVIIFSRDEIKHFLTKKRIADNRIETVVGDIRDYRSVNSVFERFDIDLVYHAAAMKHVVMCEDFPLESVKTNIIGTQNVVDLAKHNNADLITISTDKAVHPVNVLGTSKYIAERITLNAGFSCVRFGNVANSRGSVIPVFIDNLLNEKPLTVSDPDVTRFIMEISEAVKLVIKATQFTRGGAIFILKMKAFKLGDLVDVIMNRIVPKLGLSKEDIELNVSGLVLGERIHEELINNTEYNRIYELEDMYLILENDEDSKMYPDVNKINPRIYSSDDVELISKDEIERLVMNYLETIQRKFL